MNSPSQDSFHLDAKNSIDATGFKPFSFETLSYSNPIINKILQMYFIIYGTLSCSYFSTLNSFLFPKTVGNGRRDSFTIRGWQLWLKQ